MIDDTIFALASAPGPAVRCVLRVSGDEARSVVAEALRRDRLPATRGVHPVQIPFGAGSIPATAVVMPGPGSFTGEDCVELHVPGSPALVESLGRRLGPSARLARPGEFSRRAFENGRLGLDRAEAMRCLIDAQTEDEAQRAVAVLHSGLDRQIDRVRQDLLTVQALIEAGLDFEDEETGGVDPAEWQGILARALAETHTLAAQMPQVRPGADLLLLGAANAGKSSLCNALVGSDAVLVTEVAGTTRDLIPIEFAPGRRLLDAPGDLADLTADLDGVDSDSLRRRRQLERRAGAALWVLDPRPFETGSAPEVPRTSLPLAAVVCTRRDLLPDPRVLERLRSAWPDLPAFSVSTTSGSGIEELRRSLPALWSGGGGERSGASDATGQGATRATLRAAAEQLNEAEEAFRAGEPPELLSARLGEVLDRLAEIDGRHSPEDLLDRIFGGFCLGK